MTPEEFLVKMKEIEKDDDRESRHGSADALLGQVLCDLGYGEGIEVYDSMDKWYA